MEQRSAKSMNELLGKLVLVGITYLDHNENVESKTEIHGVVQRSDDGTIRIQRDGGENFTLPPDPGAFFHAVPGTYSLKSTGESVEDPDYVAQWTVRSPSTDEFEMDVHD